MNVLNATELTLSDGEEGKYYVMDISLQYKFGKITLYDFLSRQI